MVVLECRAELMSEQALHLCAYQWQARSHLPDHRHASHVACRLHKGANAVRTHRQAERRNVEFGADLRQAHPSPLRAMAQRLLSAEQLARPGRQTRGVDRHIAFQFDLNGLRRHVKSMQA